MRGGSWNHYNPDILRSAYRGRDEWDVRNDSFGFRVARTL
jgi:formylglycine-generating enzyme required for sulfatase activity